MGIEIPEDLNNLYSRAHDHTSQAIDRGSVAMLIERIATLEAALKEKDEKLQIQLRLTDAAYESYNNCAIDCREKQAQLTEACEQIERLQKPVTDEEAHNFGMFTQSGLWFTDDNVDALIRSRSQKAGQ